MKRRHVCTAGVLSVVLASLACSAPSIASSAQHAAPEPVYQAPDEQGWGKADSLRYLEYIAGDASPDQQLPLLVMIHGMGDRPAKAWMRGLDIGRPMRVIMPEAPMPMGPGFSWFEYHIGVENPPQQLAAGVSTAREQLARAIAVLTKRRPTSGLPVVCGFSQGGMLSFALALTHPELMRLAVPIAGMLPDPLWPTAGPSTKAAPAIRALHGDADTIVPTVHAQLLVKQLQTLGYQVTLSIYPGVGHTISAQMQDEINTLLQSAWP